MKYIYIYIYIYIYMGIFCVWYYTVWWCCVGTDDMVSTFHSQYCMLGVTLSSKDRDYKIILHSSSSFISSGFDCWLVYVYVYVYAYISTIRWYFSCCLFVVYVHIVCCIQRIMTTRSFTITVHLLVVVLIDDCWCSCCWLLYMMVLVRTMKRQWWCLVGGEIY